MLRHLKFSAHGTAMKRAARTKTLFPASESRSSPIFAHHPNPSVHGNRMSKWNILLLQGRGWSRHVRQTNRGSTNPSPFSEPWRSYICVWSLEPAILPSLLIFQKYLILKGCTCRLFFQSFWIKNGCMRHHLSWCHARKGSLSWWCFFGHPFLLSFRRSCICVWSPEPAILPSLLLFFSSGWFCPKYPILKGCTGYSSEAFRFNKDWLYM